MKAKYPSLLIVLLAASATLSAQALGSNQSCTNASFAGTYGYTLNGWVLSSSGYLPFADSGSITPDGNGNFSGSSTFSLNGQPQSRTFTGTYTLNSDCRGTAKFSDNLSETINLNLLIAGNGQQIQLIQTDSGTDISGVAQQQQANCSLETISGWYSLATSGWYYDANGNLQAFTDSGKLISDGAGGLTLNDVVSQGGTTSSRNISGTYSLNSNCTGTASFTSIHVNLTVVAGEVQMIQTDANTVISGSATPLKDLTAGGSMAQVAAGGGWQTTFTIVNTGTSAAQAQLSLFDNNGHALSTPLTLVQSGTTTTASSLTETIGAGATLVILAPGQSTLAIGSAQLATVGNVTGYAIFRYNPSGQEAVVPLETRNASAYVLEFDNTNGLVTGVALANVSNQAANVPIVIRDDQGATLGTASINLAARGHTSFVLTSNYAYTAGKRGTVEFDTPPGTQITVLGLRATPSGALTTIPAIVK